MGKRGHHIWRKRQKNDKMVSKEKQKIEIGGEIWYIKQSVTKKVDRFV